MPPPGKSRKKGGDGIDLGNPNVRNALVVAPVLCMFAGLFDGTWGWLWDDNENFTQNQHVQNVSAHINGHRDDIYLCICCTT